MRLRNTNETNLQMTLTKTRGEKIGKEPKGDNLQVTLKQKPEEKNREEPKGDRISDKKNNERSLSGIKLTNSAI